MFAPTAFTRSEPGYEDIGHRVQRIITDPKVQKVQSVTVTRLPDERPEDWRRLMEEISETAGIQVEPLGGDSIKIGWRGYCEV
ncbi:DUF1654 domain-containing protein [Pseudomonas sp. dw_358]|uniref:DUF1654 domain-containing protein n=1 Tax=Pseudomonas sp. dw_358 TaxID=2720083 RepID=UPI001BD69FE2|nr:DUF1654 domain-containing protein [Pseudomonas sp. dw_358]